MFYTKINKHYFNMLLCSPYTPNMANNLIIIIVGFVSSFFRIEKISNALILGFLGGIVSVYGWFHELNSESIAIARYSKKTLVLLSIGFLIFLLSEGFLFATFFCTFWHVTLNLGFYTVFWDFDSLHHNDFWYFFPETSGLPLIPMIKYVAYSYVKYLNTLMNSPLIGATLILASSSVTVHFVLLDLQKRAFCNYTHLLMLATCLLGVFFIGLQNKEYTNFNFKSNDGAPYASFYVLTGFHGLHVLIGVCLLIIQFEKIQNNFLGYFSVGLHTSVLYWHLVDLIWFILVFTIYNLYLKENRLDANKLMYYTFLLRKKINFEYRFWVWFRDY